MMRFLSRWPNQKEDGGLTFVMDSIYLLISTPVSATVGVV